MEFQRAYCGPTESERTARTEQSRTENGFQIVNRRRWHWKYWEIVADNLKKAGWSLGWVSALDSDGRTIWIVDAHRGDGKRFVARADDKPTALLELKSAIRAR